ncbi:quinone oxidoreductase [Azospirillum sp. RWY-5-1]|uniref:Quinone oxidoreductase n=1 Tax=Azospirillum oleiclasticum TaxID=2735135 RepID=A0ABX2T5P8_9PROT|nr:quinone oxidoreductase [Azospirillum oleiclasticum]NYZ11307.1 quinone oxidoreductase [Azospirillum oleiclasticum]NYZ18468.1 quinone oxidoreductase [Azospirillum oleiclasticum]
MFKAQEMRIRAYGGPEAMEMEEVTIGAPGPGQVLVRQHAVGINFIDVYHRKGVFPIPALPGAVGVEAAGVVEAVGPDVERFAPGDRVAYAGPPIGAYASARLMPARGLVRIPDALPFDQAAAIMLKGMTVHMLVTRVRPLAAGDTVLVHAAAGGLGSLLCQWASALGARVIGTVGSEAKIEAATRVGCDAVIVHRQQDFVAETKRLTDGAGVDAVYEGMGGDVLTRSLDCLKPFGTAVNLGQVGEPLGAVPLAALGPQRSLSVAVPGVFAHLRTLPDLQAGADSLFAMVTSGRVRPEIGTRLPLADAAEAHRRLEAGQTTGALVLLP